VTFLAQIERVETVRPIDGEDAVEMIDLVLQELRPVALQVDFLPGALEVLVLDPDPIGPAHADEQVGEGEAVVPHLEVLVADIHDLRVDHRPGLVHLQIDHPDRSTDLRRRDRPSGAEPGLPVPQGLTHVVHDDPNGGGTRPGNGFTLGPEDGITQEANAVDGHRDQPS